MELVRDRQRRYHGLDALRPPLAFLFLILVFLSLHILWIGWNVRWSRTVRHALSHVFRFTERDP